MDKLIQKLNEIKNKDKEEIRRIKENIQRDKQYTE